MPRLKHEIATSLRSSQRRLDCGNPRCGFARVRCPDCGEERPRIPRRGWAEMIRKVYEVDPLICPKCHGQMKVIAFITDFSVVDRIINHLKLTFVAAKPPPPHIAFQEFLMAADVLNRKQNKEL